MALPRVTTLTHRFVLINGKKMCRFCGLLHTVKNETTQCPRSIPHPQSGLEQ